MMILQHCAKMLRAKLLINNFGLKSAFRFNISLSHFCIFSAHFLFSLMQRFRVDAIFLRKNPKMLELF